MSLSPIRNQGIRKEERNLSRQGDRLCKGNSQIILDQRIGRGTCKIRIRIIVSSREYCDY